MPLVNRQLANVLPHILRRGDEKAKNCHQVGQYVHGEAGADGSFLGHLDWLMEGGLVMLDGRGGRLVVVGWEERS